MQLTRKQFILSILAQLIVPFSGVESSENILEILKVLDLSENFQSIRNLILKNHGLIRAYVHPFYISRDKTLDQNDSEVRKLAEVVENGLWKNLDSVNSRKGSSPLFIFEEKDQVDSLKEKIVNRYGKIPSGVFFVPTEIGSGIPDVNVFNKETSSKVDFEEMSSQELEIKDDFKTLFYDKLQVRKVVLGGAYFDLETREDGSQVPVKCAGDIYRWFKEIGVDGISLSRFLELKREELKLKGLK